VHILLTHEKADFDALASLLAAYRLFPDAIPVRPDQLNRNVYTFLLRYPNVFPFVERKTMQGKTPTQVTLVDTARIPEIHNVPKDIPVQIIDHHPLKRALEDHETWINEPLGATTTLLVERMIAQGIQISDMDATLMAIGIYEDCGAFTYATTTPRDIQAGAWLLTQGANLDIVRSFMEYRLNDKQKQLLDLLLNKAESRMIEGKRIVCSCVKSGQQVSEISTICKHMRDTLEVDGIFLVVQMEREVHIICRTTTDEIDASGVARAYGGGGHVRAAAARINFKRFADATAQLWQHIEENTRPSLTLAQIMSYGVHTLNADDPIDAVVGRLRRIGHEGYPVLEHGQVVGLLTRRDADRAAEHGMGNLKVREVMQIGSIALLPSASIAELESTILESGWGQIPIIDDGNIIGIVTRTDLIKHWSDTHKRKADVTPTVSMSQIEQSTHLGALVNMIAQLAQAANVRVYLVGGCVRDILLGKQSFDLDFVVEDDAIAFAQHVQAMHGGELTTFKPFGTAKWMPNVSALDVDASAFSALPEHAQHIDFATARHEFYEQPTALPTVYHGSIKLDMLRRDFTINALSIELDANAEHLRLLDMYGGVTDLQHKQLRVLHSLSFIDDPTRMLRAARFEARLGFALEARTESLIATALPLLRRITGERVRNEIDLMMQEAEPARALRLLEARQLLQAIHPAFTIPKNIEAQALKIRQAYPTGESQTQAYWHLLFSAITPANAEALCERLLISGRQRDSLVDAARLSEWIRHSNGVSLRPSEATKQLEGYAQDAITTHAIIAENDEARTRLRQFVEVWQHVRPTTDGNRLKSMGIAPGPCFKRILDHLRELRLDGKIRRAVDEEIEIKRLIREGFCDGDLS
jgi:tRNA nucleotidyltransferase (CCA-adding enzyme)